MNSEDFFFPVWKKLSKQKLTSNDKIIYGYLWAIWNPGLDNQLRKIKTIQPKIKTIAKETEIPERTIFRGLERLKKKGWIKWERTGKSNRFIVMNRS